jgi:hypothetical protein
MMGEHCRRPGEGTLGIDDPFALPQGCQPGGERPRVTQSRVLAEELQPAGVVRGIEFFEETPPEQPRQRPHWEEVARFAGDPPFAIGGDAATGHDAVHMRMVRQRRAPGMQEQGHADLRAEMLGDQQVDGENEKVAHGASRTMTTSVRKPAPRRRIPTYCEFATHRQA